MTKLGDVFKDLHKLRDELRKSCGRDETASSGVGRPQRDVEVRVIKNRTYPGKLPKGKTSGSPVSPVHTGRPDRRPQKIGPAPLKSDSGIPSVARQPVALPSDLSTPAQVAAPRPEEDWADVARLRIGAAEAFSRDIVLDIAEPDNEGELAVIGLDFGTAFTKAVVRFSGRDYAVAWDHVARLDGRDKYLMPTCFSENESGRVVLGAKTSGGWKTHQGIKMALLRMTNADFPDPAAVDTAILFVAQAMRYVQRWTRENAARASSTRIRWRLHLGLPSAAAEGPLQSLFLSIGSVGYRMAIASGPLRRSSIAEYRVESIPQVTVLPELQAQLNVYHRSKQRQNDLHVLVDVGAGTLDCAFFLDHKTDAHGDVIAVMGCRVERLGSHYLLAAMAGIAGEKCEWSDGDSSLDNAAISARTGDGQADIGFRRGKYRSRFEKAFEESYREAYGRYRIGPVNLKEQPLRVFMCGGGSRIEWIWEIVEKNLQQQFVKHGRVSGFRPTELPRPDAGSFVYDGTAYDRMSVAHGLCESKINLGSIHWKIDGEPIVARIPDKKDRDEDR